MVVIRCQGDQAQGGWRCTFWMVGSSQVHSWCSLPNQTELGDCLDCIVWNTDAQRLFLNWYVKCIRFPSGTGNAGLAIIPTNCGCLRCHRPCFKSRVDLWYLASTALVKSSLSSAASFGSVCVSPYGCLGSWPQDSTWEASSSQQRVKAFTCLQDPFG